MKYYLNSNRYGVIICAVLITQLSACSTSTLVRYEDGEIDPIPKNLRSTKLPIQYEVEFENESHNGQQTLSVVVKKNEPVKEEWETNLHRIGVYETQCKAWKDKNFFDPNNSKYNYCEFDTLAFVISHIAVIGFLYDAAIPFISYSDEKVETREPETSIYIRNDSKITDHLEPISSKNATITFNGVRYSVPLSNGVAVLNSKKMKIDPQNLPSDAEVALDFEDIHVDIGKEYADFVKSELNKKIAVETEKENQRLAVEAEKEKPENKFKLSFCSNPNLLGVIYQSNQIELEPNCIYQIQQGPIKVIQALHGGILVGLNEGVIPYAPNRIIFIETRKQFADDDPVSFMYLRSTGTKSYNTVLGAEKTVYSFRELR